MHLGKVVDVVLLLRLAVHAVCQGRPVAKSGCQVNQLFANCGREELQCQEPFASAHIHLRVEESRRHTDEVTDHTLR